MDYNQAYQEEKRRRAMEGMDKAIKGGTDVFGNLNAGNPFVSGGKSVFNENDMHRATMGGIGKSLLDPGGFAKEAEADWRIDP